MWGPKGRGQPYLQQNSQKQHHWHWPVAGMGSQTCGRPLPQGSASQGSACQAAASQGSAYQASACQEPACVREVQPEQTRAWCSAELRQQDSGGRGQVEAVLHRLPDLAHSAHLHLHNTQRLVVPCSLTLLFLFNVFLPFFYKVGG